MTQDMSSMAKQHPRSRWRSLRSNPVSLSLVSAWTQAVTNPKVDAWVFCAATGRCGTNTLADMLAPHPDVSAWHEPFPQPAHALLKASDAGDSRQIDQYWTREKFAYVSYAARGKKAYLETTHLFLHTFAEQAAATFGPKLKVIHLHRDVRQTATSFLRRGQDPLDNPWLIHPESRNNVLDIAEQVLPGGVFDDHYLRLLWYCHEVHARALRFGQTHPQTDLIDLPTEALNDRETIAALLTRLGLAQDEAVLSQCGTRSNASASKPQAPDHLDPGRIAAFEALIDDTFRNSPTGRESGLSSLVAAGTA